jgi:hypothetical protein
MRAFARSTIYVKSPVDRIAVARSRGDLRETVDPRSFMWAVTRATESPSPTTLQNHAVLCEPSLEWQSRRRRRLCRSCERGITVARKAVIPPREVWVNLPSDLRSVCTTQTWRPFFLAFLASDRHFSLFTETNGPFRVCPLNTSSVTDCDILPNDATFNTLQCSLCLVSKVLFVVKEDKLGRQESRSSVVSGCLTFQPLYPQEITPVPTE